MRADPDQFLERLTIGSRFPSIVARDQSRDEPATRYSTPVFPGTLGGRDRIWLDRDTRLPEESPRHATLLQHRTSPPAIGARPQRVADAVTAAAAPTPVRLAVISEGIASWPLYVAQSKRLFEREGIHVQMTVTGSSARQLDQLIGGEFDIGLQQSDHVVRAVERGCDLFIFMAQAHAPELSLVAAPGIHTFTALKGKEIAVDGERTGYALLLRRLLRAQGLHDGDYAFREIGGSHERSESLRQGLTSASLLNAPFDRNLFALGFESLGTIADYFPAYPGSIAAASRAWARGNRARLVAFIRAFHAAYDWLEEPANQREAIELLPARLCFEPGAAARAYAALAGRARPRIAAESLREVVDIVWQAESLPGPPAPPAKYLDLSYLEQASAQALRR